MQASASMLARNAMNRTVEHEIGKQGKYRESGLDVFRKSLEQVGAGPSLAEGTTRAQQEYDRVMSSPASVREPRGVSLGSGAATGAWADLMGALRAPVEGYNEFQLQQQIKNLRAAQQLQNIALSSRASAQAAGMETQTSQHKYDWLQAIGQMLSSGGNSGFMAAGVM